MATLYKRARNPMSLGPKTLPDVTRQIVNAELIGCLERHWLRMIAMLAVVPRHGINMLATAEREVVSPMRPRTSGVLQLGLCGQAKGGVLACLMRGDRPSNGALIETVPKSSRFCDAIPRDIVDGKIG